LALVIITVLLPLPAVADGVPNSYFSTARDEVLQQVPAGDDEVSVPWLEGVEVRAARDNSEQRGRSVAARLHLKTPGQISAEKQILNLRTQRVANSYRVALGEALRERYRLLVELGQRQQQRTLARQQQQLSEKSVTALRAMAGSSDFRPKTLQAEELRLAALGEQQRLADRRLRQARRRYDALLPREPRHKSSGSNRSDDIDLSNLLPIERLATVLETSTDGNDDGNDSGQAHSANLDLALLDANIAREQLQREQKRSGFGLRFLEFRHDDDRNTSGGDYRLTVGIDFPVGRSFSTSEKQLQYNESEYRMHQLHRRQARERVRADEELELLLDEYRVYQRRLADLDDRIGRRHHTTAALLTLSLRRERLATRAHLIELTATIYRRYIDTLQLRGLLAAEPLRNWLVNGRPPI